ncbi:MAG: thiopeptide-type bacteriocin biosynthesis protein [Bacteroidota bacterium]
MNNRPSRYFIVGSEWLYYKLYTGYKTADLILTEIIKPITEYLVQEGLVDKWFFIRYGDPNHHLRIRFHLTRQNHLNKVISALHTPLRKFMNQDLIWKIQLDTYQRELERYGIHTMELSETLFFHDSRAIVNFLDLIEGGEGEQLRWLYGLRSIDSLLDSFKYHLKQKLSLLEVLKIGFGREFGMSRPLKKQLDAKYRNERENIEAFMLFTKDTNPDYEPILSNLSEKNQAIRPLTERISILIKERKPGLVLDDLLGSYTHMLLNRLFKSQNRLNEMVCYDFLFRYYRTLSALQSKTLNYLDKKRHSQQRSS